MIKAQPCTPLSEHGAVVHKTRGLNPDQSLDWLAIHRTARALTTTISLCCLLASHSTLR